jgi:hypothetical protein
VLATPVERAFTRGPAWDEADAGMRTLKPVRSVCSTRHPVQVPLRQIVSGVGLIVMLAACDPATSRYTGEAVESHEGRVCLRAEDPKAHTSEMACGRSRQPQEADAVRVGDCVRGWLVHFPNESEKPPEGDVLWDRLTKLGRACRHPKPVSS